MSWGGPQQSYSGYSQTPQYQGYGQSTPYGQPQYGQPQYGQPQYGQPHGYGQQQPPPQYGYSSPCQQPGPALSGYGGASHVGASYTPGGYGNFQTPPPAGVSQELWHWFEAVDQDKSGKITCQELQQALMNGNWSPFNAETCRLMIGMFDKDRSGTIDVHEFAALWRYIQDWKNCFDRFDLDRSGNIDANELLQAFRTFGYNLSPQFAQLVVRTFDRRGIGRINFDDFIQACVMLKTFTDKFRVKDTQQQGIINISYEEFLEMALDNTLLGVQN